MKFYVGQTITFQATIQDDAKQLIDPTIVVMKAVSPTEVETYHSTEDGNVFSEETGYYHSYFPVDEAGIWTFITETTITEDATPIINVQKKEVRVYP